MQHFSDKGQCSGTKVTWQRRFPANLSDLGSCNFVTKPDKKPGQEIASVNQSGRCCCDSGEAQLFKSTDNGEGSSSCWSLC